MDQHSQQQLCAWIEKELGVQDVIVERELSGGNSNLTLLISADNGAMVLRTPPQAAISPKAHRGVEREGKVMAAIADSVKTPQVLAWCEDNSVIGRPFLLVSHKPGVSITSELPTAYKRGPGTLNTLGEQLVDELALIHNQDWQALGLASFGNPVGFLDRQLERWQGIREKTFTRPLPELFELAEWLKANVPSNSPVSLVHGDYHLDNTLFLESEPQLSAVIDWELATVGDPLTDLGLLLMFWGERGEQGRQPGFAHVQAVSRMPGIVSRSALAQRWSEQTTLSIDNLDFYMSFAFWRLAAIVEGAYVLYEQGKVDTPYARNLKHDVPALLAEASAAASGHW